MKAKRQRQESGIISKFQLFVLWDLFLFYLDAKKGLQFLLFHQE